MLETMHLNTSIDDSAIQLRAEKVFRSVFDSPNLELKPELSAADVNGWDSLAHVQLILAVESEFKVKFRVADVMGLNNVGELLATLRTQLAAQTK